VPGPGEAWEAALERAQLLAFDFPLNSMLNGGHWSDEELRGLLLRECPELADRLAAGEAERAPLRAPLPVVTEVARGGKKGAANQPREAKSRGGKNQAVAKVNARMLAQQEALKQLGAAGGGQHWPSHSRAGVACC
jgi:hypothetical protein